MLGTFRNVDRLKEGPKAEPVDGIMMTLDAEKYLEKTLDAMYREVPIKTLYVIDGGSKDGTIEILKKYPRVDIEINQEATMGKGLELLFNKVTTNWFVFIDNAKVPAVGWYDEMAKHQNKYDFYGSKRIIHYEFEREDPTTTDINKRPLGGPWIIKHQAIEEYHVDNDYAWRIIDVILRKAVEQAGYRYGAVPSTYHTAYLTDQERYASDETKRGTALEFKIPEMRVYDKKNMQNRLEITAKAIVKYLDPETCAYFCNDHCYLMLCDLDRQWIKETNVKWLVALDKWKKKRYLKAKIPRVALGLYRKAIGIIENTVSKAVKKHEGGWV